MCKRFASFYRCLTFARFWNVKFCISFLLNVNTSMTVGQISTKIYIIISLSWAFFSKTGKTRVSYTGSNWWLADPVTRTWKMTQMTHWPGDPMTQFHVWCPAWDEIPERRILGDSAKHRNVARSATMRRTTADDDNEWHATATRPSSLPVCLLGLHCPPTVGLGRTRVQYSDATNSRLRLRCVGPRAESRYTN